MAGKFELKQTDSGKFNFTLKAGNGQVILVSQTYASKDSAEAGIESVRNNAADDARYERKETKAGKHMFNLKAGNSQVIGTSESYESTQARNNGIASVKKNAPDAKIVDQTA